MTHFGAVLDLLREKSAADIKVFGGGIVPDDDIAELKKLGVAEVFTTGTPTTSIVTWVNASLGKA